MELLERFSRGEMGAFEALFREFQGEVYGWIVRIVRDPSTAEDLTVEAFWRMYRAHARFDPRRRSRLTTMGPEQRNLEGAEKGRGAGGTASRGGNDLKFQTANLKLQRETNRLTSTGAHGWKTWNAHAEADPEGSFGAWARRIAANLSLDYLKKMGRELPPVVDPADGPAANPGVLREMREEIARAFAKLSPKVRAVVMLALVEEVPYDEIAEALGISVVTVRVRMFRAVRVLREQLKGVAASGSAARARAI
jgi:RNA polymerase sigma factor (sigma-70 family)